MSTERPISIHIARLRCHVHTDWGLEGKYDEVGFEITTGDGAERRWLKDYREMARKLRPGIERTPNLLAYVMDWRVSHYRFQLIERDWATEDDFLGEVLFTLDRDSRRLVQRLGAHTTYANGIYQMRGSSAHYELELVLRDREGSVEPLGLMRAD